MPLLWQGPSGSWFELKGGVVSAVINLESLTVAPLLHGRFLRSPLRLVEPLMHFPTGPEERKGFRLDRHTDARAGIAPGAGSPFSDREHSEATEFDPISPAQRCRDRLENRGDEALNITLADMRILRSNAFDS